MRFRSDPSSLRGSIAPVVSPFASDGEPDYDSLRRLVRWQLEGGSHGVSLGGSTGEPSAQSLTERIDAMRVVATEIDDRVPFVPGTGSAKLDETFELTQAAIDLGADAALVITPYYSRPTQDGLYGWYSAIAAEFPEMPVILYNVPSRTAVDVAPETVARLRRDHDNIVGIKETTKDFEHFSRVFYACGRDTLMWSGIEMLCLPLLTLGGIGFVSAVANLAPQAVAAMYDHWVAGERDKALDLHYQLHPIVDSMFVETNPAPIKDMLHRAGLISSPFVRPPLVPVEASGRRRIDDLLIEGKQVLAGPMFDLASSIETTS